MEQQITTFEALYPHVSPNGLYVCEDTHTSYWKRYGGRFRGKHTFIEYSKNFIDALHAWHFEDAPKGGVSEFTKSTFGLHFYDSMLVIEKRPITQPVMRQVGQRTIPLPAAAAAGGKGK
jgi:hypothetical protein